MSDTRDALSLDFVMFQVQQLAATLEAIGCKLTGIEVASPEDEARLKQLADATRHIDVSEQAMRRQQLELCGVPFRNQVARERLEQTARACLTARR